MIDTKNNIIFNNEQQNFPNIILEKNSNIVFLGDSTTAESKIDYDNPSSLGAGFPGILASILSAQNPDLNLNFYNCGVSGNHVADVNLRFEKDVASLNPNILILLIGINDSWHIENSETFGSDAERERFSKVFSVLVNKIVNANIPQVLVMQPVLIPINSPNVFPAYELKEVWEKDIGAKRDIIEAESKKAGFSYFDLNKYINSLNGENEFYSSDGIHPTRAGHGATALKMLEFFNAQKI